MTTQQTAKNARMPPTNIHGNFLDVGLPAIGRAAGGATAWTCAAFGNGDPQFEQTELLPGFSVPQLLHLIVFGCAAGACITRPDSRTLPSVRSPPH
jgi:hypothetical protein